MANNSKSAEVFGPVLSCGASSMSFSHKAGESTQFDRLFAAVKSPFSKKNRSTSRVDGADIDSSDRDVATSYGAAS